MKANFLLSLLPMLALTACGGSKTNPNPGPDPTEETETLEITFLNNESFQIGGVEEHKDAFVNAANGVSDLITSVSATSQNGTQIANNFSETMYISSILQFGSQKSDAFLTFSFKYAVTEIEVEAQAYWKSFYQGGSGPLSYSVDTKSNLYVGNNNNKMDLSTEGGQEPEKVKTSFEFDKSYSVKIYNKMDTDERARAFIHSMKITYIVPEE